MPAIYLLFFEESGRLRVVSGAYISFFFVVCIIDALQRPEPLVHLVWCLTIGWWFAASDFGLPLGASNEHTRPGSVRSEPQRGRPKALRPRGLRPQCPLGFVAPRSQVPADMLPWSASPKGHLERNETPAHCETPH